MGGVIVVTTKKGKAGTAKISYSGEFTYRLKPSYRNFNIMNSQQQMGVYKELADEGWLGLAATSMASESGVYGKMYELIDTYDPVSGSFLLENTPEARNAYLASAEMRNTDWFDLLFKNSVQQNHSVSITAGTERATYYASLSALVDPGWYKQSNVSRYTGNFNSTFNITKGLSLNMIVAGSYRNQKAPGTLSQEVGVVSGS